MQPEKGCTATVQPPGRAPVGLSRSIMSRQPPQSRDHAARASEEDGGRGFRHREEGAVDAGELEPARVVEDPGIGVSSAKYFTKPMHYP